MNTTDETSAGIYRIIYLSRGISLNDARGERTCHISAIAGLLRNLPVESRNSMFRQASRLLKITLPVQAAMSSYRRAITTSHFYRDKSTAEAYPAASHVEKQRHNHRRASPASRA
ncbi:MAG: hypothetical protein MZV63_02545 [Marinilabiliales bacterium]|nr:hypothetical protein [Marinilabiliales bacterium]